VTDAALSGRAFDPPSLSPRWLRPAVIAIVVALHAAALFIVALTPKPPEPLREVIIDVEPEAPPSEAPAPPAEAPKPPEPSASEPAPSTTEAPPPEPAPSVAIAPPPPVAEQPPLPPAELPPPAETPSTPPPFVEAPPPVATPPPVAEAPPPPRAPVELPPSKPRAPPRIESRPKPVESVRPRSETPERKPLSPAPRRTASLEAGRPEAQASRPAAPASAASQSAYISEISGAIRSRMFYPEAARARGARGVVGVAFTIESSGAVAAFAITRPSGDHDLDAAARTLVQSSHFPPPPDGPVHIATSFNYVPR
jgi:protein TonB